MRLQKKEHSKQETAGIHNKEIKVIKWNDILNSEEQNNQTTNKRIL